MVKYPAVSGQGGQSGDGTYIPSNYYSKYREGSWWNGMVKPSDLQVSHK